MQDPIEKSTQGDPPLPTQTVTYGEIAEPASSGVGLEAEEMQRTEEAQIRTPLRDAIRRFRRNWAAVTSVAVILFLILAAVFAPLLHTTDPTVIDYNALNQGPTWQHWFGTDPEGRDEYSRLLFGMRIPFIIAFSGTFITLVLGLAFGMLAGFFGGIADAVLARFTDFMFAFPAFMLIIIIVSLYGPTFDANFPNGVGRAIILTLVFALVSWPPLMRFVRSLALSLKEQQFVEAARTVGTRPLTIITRHLVPSVWGLVLVQASFFVASIVSTEAVLSIIGLGVNQPTPDLGSMLYDGASYMDANAWGVFFPSLVLTVIILAFTFIGDGIRDAVDPRMRD